MYLRSACLIAGLLASRGAVADTTVTSVSLDDLKAKCADLTANPQLKPIKVQITCNELSYFWAADKAKDAELPNLRNVGAMVQMKGFQVAHQFFNQETQTTPIQCQQFVKFERKVSNVDVEISCQELADVKDLGTYCSPIVSQRAEEDKDLVEQRATDEVLSLCPTQIR